MDATAFITAALDGNYEDEIMAPVADGITADLESSRPLNSLTAFGSIVVHLLDRLTGLTGRDKDELWREVAQDLATIYAEPPKGDEYEF